MDTEETLKRLQSLPAWAELAHSVELVIDLESQIAKLQAQMEEIKRQDIYAFLAKVLAEAQAQGFTSDAATFLYWYMPHIPPSYVKNVLGVKKGASDDHIQPVAIPVVCRVCGEPKTFYIKSKTAYISERSRGTIDRYQCNDCTRRSLEEMRASSQEFMDRLAAKLHELRTMPYRDYLQTDHWKDVRRRALSRAQYRCQLCNTNKTQLQVHHRTYENRGQEKNADVIVLCATCHETFHTERKLSYD